jgi:hypothetical protein
VELTGQATGKLLKGGTMNTILIVAASVLIFLLTVFLALTYYGFCSFLKNDDKERDFDKAFENLREPWKSTYRPYHEYIMSEKLFALCASDKEFWIDDDASHDMVGWVNKDAYQKRIKAFINKYMGVRHDA